jgi:hypothetical protein
MGQGGQVVGHQSGVNAAVPCDPRIPLTPPGAPPWDEGPFLKELYQARSSRHIELDWPEDSCDGEGMVMVGKSI